MDESSQGSSSVVFSMGHARALLNLPSEEEQIKVYYRTLKDGLSVRKVEELVRVSSHRRKKGADSKATGIEEFGATVEGFLLFKSYDFYGGRRKRKNQIDFTSENELEKIIMKLND